MVRTAVFSGVAICDPATWGAASQCRWAGSPSKATSRIELLRRHTPLYSFLYGRMPPSIPGCQLRGLWSTPVYCPHRALFAAWVVRPPGPDLWAGFQPCGISRRYCRHGRGRIRRGKRSMEYASILGRMCTCLLHIFFAFFFIIPQYLVFVNQIIDFYINILCFQELSNARRTISCT